MMKLFETPLLKLVDLNVYRSSYILNETNDISTLMMIFKIIFYLIVFIVIIILAYIWTKFIAKKKGYAAKSKNAKLIDMIKIGNNMQIYIIKISNKVYIVATNNNSITLIDKVTYENFAVEEKEVVSENLSFNSYLDKILNTIKPDNGSFKDKIDLSNLNKRVSELKSKVTNIKNTDITSNKDDEDDENEEI